MTILSLVYTSLIALIGYLIGSISFSILIAKLKGVDIKSVGSGNAGATNVTRNLGKKIGLLTVLLDVSKPIIAVSIGLLIKKNIDTEIYLQPIAFGATIGHIYPIWHNFKGGKGAATIAGFFVTINWTFFFIGIIILFIMIKLTKYVSLSAILTIYILTIVASALSAQHFFMDGWLSLFYDSSTWVLTIVFCVLMSAITTIAHKENIKSLINGTERRVGNKK